MPPPSRSITLGLTVAAAVMGVRLVTDVAQPAASVGAVVVEPAPAPSAPSAPVNASEPPPPAAALDPEAVRRLELGRYLAPDGLASLLATGTTAPDTPRPPAGQEREADDARAGIPVPPLAHR